MSARVGPLVTVQRSCFGCVHERSERYVVQGDSGHDITCAHPDAPQPPDVGDSAWNTPAWCPVAAAEPAEKFVQLTPAECRAIVTALRNANPNEDLLGCLLYFGGAAELGTEPKSPGGGFRMARYDAALVQLVNKLEAHHEKGVEEPPHAIGDAWRHDKDRQDRTVIAVAPGKIALSDGAGWASVEQWQGWGWRRVRCVGEQR